MLIARDGSSQTTGAGLVGRAEELQLIRSFLDRVPSVGDALMIVGEPGIGKTELLNRTADAALAAGIRVLRVEGVEFEADLAFSGLNQAFMPLLGEFDQLRELHRNALTLALGLGHGSTPGRLVVANSALSLLRLAAEPGPILLLVDDLQWLDRSSADVLSFVARRASGSRVGFLSAARSGADSCFDRGAVPTYELGRLDDAAASELLQARFPELAPRVRAGLLAEAQGNPLALLELPGALSGQLGIRRPTLQRALSPAHRVQAMFASRVAALPAETRTLLLLEVLDGTGELGVLRSASGDAELLGLAPGEQAGLVQVDEDNHRLVFRHPLIRAGVMGNSTDYERRRGHLALAEALVEQPERRAWHLAEATTQPDEEVATLLEAVASETLRRGDAIGAAAALQRAAELSPRPADRGRRLARAAYVARVTADVSEVRRLLAEAHAADPPSSESLEAAVAGSYLLLTDQGDIDTAHRVLVRAIEARADRSAVVDNVLADALQTLLSVCWFGGRPELWEPFEIMITRFAPNIPKGLALFSRFYADPVRASAPALTQLDSAVGALREMADPADVARIVDSAVFLDRLGGCRQTLWQVVGDGRVGNGNTSVHTALIALSIDDYLTGQWEEADDLLQELLGLSQGFGYHMLWPAQHVQALLAAARGDFETTWALTDEMSRWAEPRGMHAARWYCYHARTLAALGQGDFEYAYLQASAISPPGTFAAYVPHALWVAMDLVEAAVHTNRHAEAAAHVTAMQTEGIAALSPRLALLASASAAIAAPDDQASELFDEALALPGIDRWPFDLARVELAYGARLRRAQTRIKAREHLSAALDVFRWLGALPWATRASNELRASGRTRFTGRASPPTRLTPQEHQIAMLAAAGMTNKEIGERLKLSHRTVSSHLHRIYPKLGIATRSALHDALAGTQSLADRPLDDGSK